MQSAIEHQAYYILPMIGTQIGYTLDKLFHVALHKRAIPIKYYINFHISNVETFWMFHYQNIKSSMSNLEPPWIIDSDRYIFFCAALTGCLPHMYPHNFNMRGRVAVSRFLIRSATPKTRQPEL